MIIIITIDSNHGNTNVNDKHKHGYKNSNYSKDTINKVQRKKRKKYEFISLPSQRPGRG